MGRLLAPEVIQTSAMDCGPASLKCLLDGFGITASYGRLREACQTEVDGTSIDTIEEVARLLGLEAEQVMVPLDHLALPQTRALPGVVVVRQASGVNHFVVAWRSHGRTVQVMDPATGRRWSAWPQFLREVHVHTMPVAARLFRRWIAGDEGARGLCARLGGIRVRGEQVRVLLADADDDPSWRSYAALDAATRMAAVLHRAQRFVGRETAAVVESLYDQGKHHAEGRERAIPDRYWSVTPIGSDEEGEPQLLLRGAVVVRVLGRRTVSAKEARSQPRELTAALAERPVGAAGTLLDWLRADGLVAPAALTALVALAAAGLLLEAMLFRSLLDLRGKLALSGQTLAATAALVALLALLALLESTIRSAGSRLGRGFELRLRAAFLSKLRRLQDRYFGSRLISDMAFRSHELYQIRTLPLLGGNLLHAGLQLVFTTIGIALLSPGCAWLAAAVAAASIGLSLLAKPLLVERDLRVRDHAGALTRFTFDALMGLVAVRCHGAEDALSREHEAVLMEWTGASQRLSRMVTLTEAVQTFVGFAGAVALIRLHFARVGVTGAGLLVAYWALMLPMLAQQLAGLIRQYPAYRNITLRLLEPLGAPEEASHVSGDQGHDDTAPDEPRGAVAISLGGVTVRAGGQTILSDISVAVAAGEHVAIVGPSGAGKSTLVGLLLGWHRGYQGELLVDGRPLDGPSLERLRGETAWVDPAVQLWNRSIYENLHYGVRGNEPPALAAAMEMTELHDLLEHLVDGMQTPLGEGGALVSGGEGQRVRLARALQKRAARLVILDEPFRGLDRATRQRLLAGTRSWWCRSTIVCVTHDLRETLAFDRVLVLENGRIVEDGSPAALAVAADSRYRRLLSAEDAALAQLRGGHAWRQMVLRDGVLHDVTTDA